MSRTIKKAYTGSKAFDSSCRNHGSCSYCRDNRLFSRKRDELFADIDILVGVEEFFEEKLNEDLNQQSNKESN